MYVENGWLSLDPIYLSLLHATRIFGQFPRTWMDFKMADTSERWVFCNTILLKYHGNSILSVFIYIYSIHIINMFICK